MRLRAAAAATLLGFGLGGCAPRTDAGAGPTLTVGTFVEPTRWDPRHRADAATAGDSLPYVVESWTRGDELILAANPRYRRPAPAYRTIVIRTIPDPNTGVLALEKHDIDALVDPRPEDVAALREHGGVAFVPAQADRPGLAFGLWVQPVSPGPGGALNLELWRPRP
jgi:ABC-type transport system substrate-binding protein